MSTHLEEAQIKVDELKHSAALGNSTHPEEVQLTATDSPVKDQHCMDVEETTSEEERPKCEQEEQHKLPEAAAETEVEAEEEENNDEDSVRERLKRHRIEMAGRVWIPEIWGHEKLLKDWSDCSAFDQSLVPNGLVSARTALVEDCRRTTSGAGIVENRCS